MNSSKQIIINQNKDLKKDKVKPTKTSKPSSHPSKNKKITLCQRGGCSSCINLSSNHIRDLNNTFGTK